MSKSFIPLGGLVLEQLQHIPEAGETFVLAGFNFRGFDPRRSAHLPSGGQPYCP